MIDLFIVIFFVLLCLYFIIAGSFYGTIIIDSDVEFQDDNKKHLFCLICGPLAWIIGLGLFCINAFISLQPQFDKMIDWFIN